MLISQNKKYLTLLAVFLIFIQPAWAGINLDRTRVIFDGNMKSVSLHIDNNDAKNPYLAQSWLEDEYGNKGGKLPLVVVPPIQRVEPGASSQLRIEALPTIKNLPQDRESIFYLVIQDIPPKVTGNSVLQIAVQNRVKLMYRPNGLDQHAASIEEQWQHKVRLKKSNKQVVITNPTPYNLTIINVSTKIGGAPVDGFKPLMIHPYDKLEISLQGNHLGQHPTLNYINDFGGVGSITLQCSDSECVTTERGRA
ncbi:TPA: fimbria/pilus periplasmic chaperone [Aeromonas veronii]|nr:fimbria/pilus periplasmic chaperone [Aeromonas veronii]